ncbi:MAG: type I DNA topoisomerase [Candidatus Margulisiibacteriota bacterium]
MGKKHLVIVESPAKAKTIERYLGADYAVKASYGHVRDLPVHRLGVDLKNEFAPTYAILKDKTDVIKTLKKEAQKADDVLIATDPDREGEAIAWHIQESLDVPQEKIKRIVFNEITKHAILNAIQHSRAIDAHLVDAQQARRILDRLIGYKLSPILSKKIRKGLSAGRVQSVALRLICDREREIQAFVPVEYWLVDALVHGAGTDPFKARLFAQNDAKKKLEIGDEASAAQIKKALESASYAVDEVKNSVSKRSPQPPFITSTLQQAASSRFNWTTKKTMMVAQQLYEGVAVDGGHVGLITYMRTDSFRVANEARDAAQSYVNAHFGNQFLPEKPRFYASKKSAQDAHEAIRPSYVDRDPDSLRKALSPDHFKLYQLIWGRFMASQMADALFDVRQITVAATSGSQTYFLKAQGQALKFEGHLKATGVPKKGETESENDEEQTLPDMKRGETLALDAVMTHQKFTQPPSRFSEATLVRELEERGIGRPSTYAPTVSLIQDRHYVEKEVRHLVPTELGFIVNDQLVGHFADVVNYQFTAQMEDKLDEITEGKHLWQDVVSEFYQPFEKELATAAEKMQKVNMDKPTNEVCEKCGHPMVIKTGRFGEFLSCSNYPECKNTRSIVVETGVPCPKCGSPIAEKHSKRGKVFYGCSGYPKCTFALWDKPLTRTCEKCQHPFLVEKKLKGRKKPVITCPECGAKYE